MTAISLEALSTLEKHADRLLTAGDFVQVAAIAMALHRLGNPPAWAKAHRAAVEEEEHGAQRVRFYEERPGAIRRGLEGMVARANGELAQALAEIVGALAARPPRGGAA